MTPLKTYRFLRRSVQTDRDQQDCRHYPQNQGGAERIHSAEDVCAVLLDGKLLAGRAHWNGRF